MKRISGVVITCNEAEKIAAALASLRPVCDEIVVVDSFSNDETPEICRRLADRFVQREWPGYREQKQFATELATCDWVLSLDADERLSRRLQAELAEWKSRAEDAVAGYRIPRLAYFWGRWIRHTIWYPDWQLRLFRKDAGRWSGGRVHESFKVTGAVGTFEAPIYHYTYATLQEYLEQLQRFSRLAALDAWEKGARPRRTRLVAEPPLVFLKSYLLKLGFLDGLAGFLVSALAGVSCFFKQAHLAEIARQRSGGEPPWEELEAQ
ncbi:MAG: glycosyltransferase family 2 protein [Acidobacteriota bacterium]